uniref:Zgc:162780 n=1 Tax=Gasterosteus aculeatus aculeatus TaxID=481459 RepID=A0AAQ4PLH7_GASAC|nr:biotin biosynthesis bifunctional protein BioHC-like isoform X1 [Gasterosteus aculeatus aculeatus]
MAFRLYEGKEHARSYWKYRIAPTDLLIQQVLNFLEKQMGRPFERAADVGCGSGQGTVLLAEHFASVLGTDVSPAQLEMALQHSKKPNITYRECAAEQLPCADSSLDLVTAMSAFHWFDRPRFLQEAHRVLKPRGCLALLNYTIDMQLGYPGCCSHTLNQVCKEAGVCVGGTAHASVQLHGVGGVFLQLSGASERRPAESHCPLSRHQSEVDVHNEGDLSGDRGACGGEVFLPAGLQTAGSLTPHSPFYKVMKNLAPPPSLVNLWSGSFLLNIFFKSKQD